MREIGRHDGRRAAKKAERVGHHQLVSPRHELGDPLGVGFGQNGHGVAIQGAMQFRVGFARGAISQRSAVLVSVCAVLQSTGHDENPLERKRVSAQIPNGPTRPVGRLDPTQSIPARNYSFDPGLGNLSGVPGAFLSLLVAPVKSGARSAPANEL
jgi:hypothetical protein